MFYSRSPKTFFFRQWTKAQRELRIRPPPFNCALEILLLTYLRTHLLTYLGLSAVVGRRASGGVGGRPVPAATETVPDEPDPVHRVVRAVRLRHSVCRLAVL